jgi:NAD(P)H-dependent FMN reductase
MRVQIIVGATREGRVSDKMAQWVFKEAQNLPDTEAEVVDLADYPMPFFDEAVSPQYNPDRKPIPAVKKWLDKLTEADAFVLVTPEYNRSFSAVLKNAIDYADFQFAKKPVAIVAHGSTGGAQAVAGLRAVLPGVQTITVPSATFFVGRAGEMLDDSGELTDEEARSNPYGVQGALKTTLDQLKWYSDALAAARAKD